MGSLYLLVARFVGAFSMSRLSRLARESVMLMSANDRKAYIMLYQVTKALFRSKTDLLTVIKAMLDAVDLAYTSSSEDILYVTIDCQVYLITLHVRCDGKWLCDFVTQ